MTGNGPTLRASLGTSFRAPKKGHFLPRPSGPLDEAVLVILRCQAVHEVRASVAAGMEEHGGKVPRLPLEP